MSQAHGSLEKVFNQRVADHLFGGRCLFTPLFGDRDKDSAKRAIVNCLHVQWCLRTVLRK